MNLLCFGYGQVAKNLVSNLLKKKVNLNLTISTRENSSIKKLGDFEFENLQFKENTYDKKILDKLNEYDYILISVPPINSNDLFLKILANHVSENSKIKSILYLSSTSVYGDHNGEWVTENSITKPTSPNGIDRLNAENLWKKFSEKFNLPLQIFRLAGIYSNEFNILKRLKLKKVKVVDKENHFFSRIHVDDIANILFRSLENFKNREVYNICDDKPASQSEVATYGASLLELEKPIFVKEEELDSEMLKNFYKDSKKVDNNKMKNFFKYELKYPTYKEGLNYILNNIV